MAFAARHLLADLSVLRARTRARRQAYWLPLTLFGALGVAAAPLYVQHPPPPGTYGGGPVILARAQAFLLPLGGMMTGHPILIAATWLVGIPAVCLATALAYRQHAARVGLASDVRPFLAVALVLDAALLILGELQQQGHLPWQVAIHGLIAYYVVTAALAALAWSERSAMLAIVTVGLAAITTLVTLYDVENEFFRLGVPFSYWSNGLPNPLLPAVFLLCCGGIARIAEGRRR